VADLETSERRCLGSDRDCDRESWLARFLGLEDLELSGLLLEHGGVDCLLEDDFGGSDGV
jgi:hypothetical protein